MNKLFFSIIQVYSFISLYEQNHHHKESSRSFLMELTIIAFTLLSTVLIQSMYLLTCSCLCLSVHVYLLFLPNSTTRTTSGLISSHHSMVSNQKRLIESMCNPPSPPPRNRILLVACNVSSCDVTLIHYGVCVYI